MLPFSRRKKKKKKSSCDIRLESLGKGLNTRLPVGGGGGGGCEASRGEEGERRERGGVLKVLKCTSAGEVVLKNHRPSDRLRYVRDVACMARLALQLV